MGRARIISGGTDGRYTIELDFGQATRDAILASIDEVLAKVDAALVDSAAEMAAADAGEQQARELLDLALAQMVAAQSSPQPGDAPADDRAVQEALLQLRAAEVFNAPTRLRDRQLRFERTQLLRQRARYADLQLVEKRGAWCADYTDDRAPDSTVATIDIPGESGLVLIAPGAPPWTPAYGELVARDVMSPAQAFFNAAILPGWQIDKPTHRWGTIVGLNVEAETATVDLFDARSTAQSLAINRTPRLVDVPVHYMNCGISVFEIGDRVVVEFIGQSWDSPRVIGFLDNPKPCSEHYLKSMSHGAFPAGALEASAFVSSSCEFESLDEAFTTQSGELAASSFLTVQARRNGGGWITVPQVSPAALQVYHLGDAAFPAVGAIELSIGTGGCTVNMRTNATYNGGQRLAIGDTVEVLVTGAGVVRFNAAVRLNFNAPAQIAATGRIRYGLGTIAFDRWPPLTDLFDAAAAVPLDYTLRKERSPA